MGIHRIVWLGTLGLALVLAACGAETGLRAATATPPAPPPGPTPLAAASPEATPGVAPQASATAPAATRPPRPALTGPTAEAPMPTPTPALLTPAEADRQGLEPEPQPFYLQDARLDGPVLHVEGAAPTPCHRPVVEVAVHGGRVQVRLYTRRMPGVCIEVLQPVTADLDLRPYVTAAGEYEVVLNGQVVGRVTRP